ncbi:MAG: isoprenyl transferase [Planctomycetota bacterium]|nr:isoprenyl transferase [Planctomycetota bacterium]MDP6942372.1 isoprenyl transferase [Planctomycetota bacterium]
MSLRPDFPVPEHVAIIMDGNGRWARKGGMIRVRGHESGTESVRDVVEASAEWGVKHLTLYAFSVENWSRPKAEVSALMSLLKKFLNKERETLLKNGIALRGLGRLEDLPDSVLRTLREIEKETAHGTKMTLRLALSYGGRQEMVDAVRVLSQDISSGKVQATEVNEESLAGYLYDSDMPDPDLIIRTAGEKRLSNFLLWQASYAEFVYTDILWPEFRRGDLLAALQEFDGRVRRFGKVLDTDPEPQGSSSP